MHEYVFLGKIYPERVNFGLDSEIHIKHENPDFDIEGDIYVAFESSNMVARYTSEKIYSSEKTGSLETLKNILEEDIRLIVDIYCYVKSYSYDLEITRVVCKELNLDYTFGVQGEWNISKSKENTDKELNKIIMVLTDKKFSFLKYVFADFRRSIKYPVMTPSFCYRAIETLRKSYFEDSWDKLNSTLGFTKYDYGEILKFSTPNRHGEYPGITYKQREKIMNFTRGVIDSFLNHVTANSLVST
jgi:hypothetical protein